MRIIAWASEKDITNVQRMQITRSFRWLELLRSETYEISATDLQKPFREFKNRNSFLWTNTGVTNMLTSQPDCNGWRQFMEGMVGKKIFGTQEAYLLIEGTHTSAPNWLTGLIHKLLRTTHGQRLNLTSRCTCCHQNSSNFEEEAHTAGDQRITGAWCNWGNWAIGQGAMLMRLKTIGCGRGGHSCELTPICHG